MVQQKIQLRKVRDFSQNFSDTFQFIRQEFKPLVSSFLFIAGIFILANAIFSGLYQKQAFGFLDQLIKGVSTSEIGFSTILTPTYFVLVGVTVISISAMRTVIAVYMKLYDETETSPTVQQVWSGFTKYFFLVLLFGIFQVVLFFIGFILCIVPGVWILIVFMPYPFVMVNENLSFGETFSRCLDIIKENFWISLAIYLIAYLIYAVSSTIIGFSISLIIGLFSYFTTKELSSTAAIVMSVLNIVQYLFYIIFFISVGLHYYNLIELRDGTGLARRVSNLGENANPNTQIEEQY